MAEEFVVKLDQAVEKSSDLKPVRCTEPAPVRIISGAELLSYIYTGGDKFPEQLS